MLKLPLVYSCVLLLTFFSLSFSFLFKVREKDQKKYALYQDYMKNHATNDTRFTLLKTDVSQEFITEDFHIKTKSVCSFLTIDLTQNLCKEMLISFSGTCKQDQNAQSFSAKQGFIDFKKMTLSLENARFFLTSNFESTPLQIDSFCKKGTFFINSSPPFFRLEDTNTRIIR